MESSILEVLCTTLCEIGTAETQRMVQILKLALKADHKGGVSLEKLYIGQFRITLQSNAWCHYTDIPCFLMMNHGLQTCLLKLNIAINVYSKLAYQKQYIYTHTHTHIYIYIYQNRCPQGFAIEQVVIVCR